MDLKFSFGGASPDQHDHGGAPSGIPLPFAGAATSLTPASTVLEVRVTLAGEAVVAEALSGNGVTYARAARSTVDLSPAGLAAAARSAIARAGAELGDRLVGTVSAVVLALGEHTGAVLQQLELDAADPAVSEALQARTGISAGTPIRLERVGA